MRRFGIILLGVGLAVAMSCSKDNIDDVYNQQIAQLSDKDTTKISDLIVASGIFEGEWRLSKYGKTCEGRIEVNGDEITFDIPADYLFPRLGFVTDQRKAMYPEEPLFTTDYLSYIETQMTIDCFTQGISKNAAYYQIMYQIDDDQFASSPSFGIKADNVNYRIDLFSIKEQSTAVFDNNTRLWTVAIPIDQVSAYNCQTSNLITSSYLDEENPDKSAWLLVFRATKRIK